MEKEKYKNWGIFALKYFIAPLTVLILGTFINTKINTMESKITSLTSSIERQNILIQNNVTEIQKLESNITSLTSIIKQDTGIQIDESKVDVGGDMIGKQSK